MSLLSLFCLATTDIVFALDSIPAVFAIVSNTPQRDMIIYTSNIFAVLGLRSLFFLLQGAVNKFAHLQQGIAVVLIFIGLKMLLRTFRQGACLYFPYRNFSLHCRLDCLFNQHGRA